MTILTLKCQRCGGDMPPIDSDDDDGKELLRLMGTGGAEILHETCPGEEPAPSFGPAGGGRRFEARVVLVEVIAPTEEGGDASLEELAGFTAYVDAPSFSAGLRPLALALGTKWQELERVSGMVDLPVLDGSE